MTLLDIDGVGNGSRDSQCDTGANLECSVQLRAMLAYISDIDRD